MSAESSTEVTDQQDPGATSSEPRSLLGFLKEILDRIHPDGEIRTRRLDQDMKACGKLDKRLTPLGLILGATSTLEREQVQSYYRSLKDLVEGEAQEALDLVSETLLMVDDRDLQASGAIAASLLVQRSLPDGTGARDLVLQSVLDLLGNQYQERMTRHPDIFAPLRRIKNNIAIRDLPRFLTEISDGLEDMACEAEIFLDNPIELTTSPREVAQESEEVFRKARVESGADLPTLSDEIEQIEKLAELLEWDRDRGIEFVTELYQKNVMDSRTKVGLSVGAILGVVEDLNEVLDTPVKSLKVEDEHGTEPYTYDADSGTIILNLKYRGTLTSTLLRSEHQEIREKAREAEIVVVTNLLEEAVKRYHAARKEARLALTPEAEEREQLARLAGLLGLTEIASLDLLTGLYKADRISFSSDPKHGISVKVLGDLVEAASEVAPVKHLQVDGGAAGNLPYTLDRESATVVLHSAFNRLHDAVIELFLAERAFESLGLAEPDEQFRLSYEDPGEAGSLTHAANLETLIEEFTLASEFAQDSFEVLFEDFPQFRDQITIQTLRVLVATLNDRLASQGLKINVITGWSRQVPGTHKPDHDSVAWLTAHEEDDSKVIMLTFNFHYGEEKSDYPPMSNELLLDWCRHFKASTIGEME